MVPFHHHSSPQPRILLSSKGYAWSCIILYLGVLSYLASALASALALSCSWKWNETTATRCTLNLLDFGQGRIWLKTGFGICKFHMMEMGTDRASDFDSAANPNFGISRCFITGTEVPHWVSVPCAKVGLWHGHRSNHHHQCHHHRRVQELRIAVHEDRWWRVLRSMNSTEIIL